MGQAESDGLVPAKDSDRARSDAVTANKTQPVRGAAAAMLAASLMAGYVVLGKSYVGSSSADQGGGPGVFLISRQLLASVLLAIVALSVHGPRLPQREHYGALQMLGFLNFLNSVGFIWGMKLTTAFITSVMQLSIPVFTLAYATCSGQVTILFVGFQTPLLRQHPEPERPAA